MDDRSTVLAEITTTIQAIKSKRLHFYEEYKNYNEKLGLGSRSPADASTIDLPLHPNALQMELEDYKHYFRQLKIAFNEVEHQEKFLRSILKEPPLQTSLSEVQSIEYENERRKRNLQALKADIKKHQDSLLHAGQSIDEARRSLMKKTDAIMDEFDAIYAMEGEIKRIQELVKQQSDLSPEEAKAILEEQTEACIAMNTLIDERREVISDLSWRVEDLEQELQELTSRQQTAEAKAAEALQRSENRDEQVEEKTRWYKDSIEQLNALFGIKSVNFESPQSVYIHFDTAKQEILHIETDSLTQRILDANLTNSERDIRDLVKIAKERHPEEGTKLLLLETLARIKYNL
ncbi:uncharacterized protein BYT42DRAFT_203140 [Radiomyces spectabilis]|uniref:uncharacterized protein n=1 Tax=Radiomyces spectabilis TaxID=64574 RepID=UPI00221EC806|nr:uncharacterized protein BYT42DRAFT_203140 [Radiomyces spectabilis]KAI8391660.1 hypothetical protein BYT42DRAFT_203140 [Radiomyces spectabilis]